MKRLIMIPIAMVLCMVFLLSCSGAGNPVTPPQGSNLSSASAEAVPAQTHLWGYYDVYIDIPAHTATAVPNRGAMFSANVVQFVNNPVSNLSFNIRGTPVGSGYVDVDIDVSIKHPFTGQTQYNGYDVRGIFIGNATTALKYDTDLKYAVHYGTTDQEMYDYAATSGDPGVYGNPDGYTRWFNPPEFSKTGLFGYTKGKVATPGYTGTATLNPYKYFADGLAVSGNAYTFMTATTGNGVFSAGTTNTRNYYLRFPTATGIKFNYAIVANWINETTHPANAPEACAISASVVPDIYYVSGSDKGGKLKVNFSLPRQWGFAPSIVYIESSVLNNPYQLATSEMIPTGGNAAYSTYHAEVTADNITGNSNTVKHEFWVIPQYDEFNYKNTFGVTNLAGDDKLAAFFRYDLNVSPTALNKPPVAFATADKTLISASESVTFDGSGSTDSDGTIVNWEWDFDGNGTYGDAKDGGTEDKPVKLYMTPGKFNVGLKVTDNLGATDTLDTPLVITVDPESGWVRTWGGNDYDTSMFTDIDSFGNIYVAGFFVGNDVDFDPGAGTDLHSSKGSYDVFLSKFSPSGSFQWAITFGGSDDDRAYTVTTDSTGIYVAGFFISSDFDPGNGTPVSTIGGWDCWMSKFDFDGTCLWAKTWGGSNHDHLYCSDADGAGGIYVGGGFTSSDVDFDPGPGVENQPSNGTWDSWISKFNSDGEFQWAGVWGWYYDESVNGIVAVQGGGNVYCSGNYGGDVDFDPDPAKSDNQISYSWYLDAFVSCFNTSGVYQWVKTWEGDGDERAWELSLDTSGNIYVAGVVNSGIDLNPDVPFPTDPYYSQGDWDIWLCKLDSTGSFLWGKGWGGYYADMPYGIGSDGSDNVYVTGYFRSPFVDFDPSGGDHTHDNAGGWNGEADIYLSKFGSSGNLSWAQTWGSPGQDIGDGVVTGPSNASFLTGSFSGTVDFKPGGGDPHDATAGSEDVFLMKILPGGTW